MLVSQKINFCQITDLLILGQKDFLLVWLKKVKGQINRKMPFFQLSRNIMYYSKSMFKIYRMVIHNKNWKLAHFIWWKVAWFIEYPSQMCVMIHSQYLLFYHSLHGHDRNGFLSFRYLNVKSSNVLCTFSKKTGFAVMIFFSKYLKKKENKDIWQED